MDQQGDISEPEDGEILDEYEESPRGSSPEGEYEHRRLRCDKRTRSGRGSRSSAGQHSHHLSRTQGHRRSQYSRRNGSNSRYGQQVSYSRSRSSGSPHGYQRSGGRSKASRRSPSLSRRASASGSVKLSSYSKRSKVTFSSRTGDRKISSRSYYYRQGGSGSRSSSRLKERRKKSPPPKKRHMPEHSRTENDCASSSRSAGSYGVTKPSPEGSKWFSLPCQDQNFPVNTIPPLPSPAAILSLLSGSTAQNGVAAQPDVSVPNVPNVETEPVSDDSSVEVIPEEEVAALKKSPLIITLDTTDTSDDEEDQNKVKKEEVQALNDKNENRVDLFNVETNVTNVQQTNGRTEDEVVQLHVNQHSNDGSTENAQAHIPSTVVVASGSTLVSDSGNSANNVTVDLPIDGNRNTDCSEEEEEIYELELRNQLLADLVEKTAKQETASTGSNSKTKNPQDSKDPETTGNNADEHRRATGASDAEDDNLEEENALREVLLSQMKNKMKKLPVVNEDSKSSTDGYLEPNPSSVIETLPGPSSLQDASTPNSSALKSQPQPIERVQSNASTPKTRAGSSSSSKNRRGRGNRQRNRHKSGGSQLFSPTLISPPIGIETHHHRMIRLGVEPPRNSPNSRNLRNLPDNDLRNKLLRNRRNEQQQQQQTPDPSTSLLTTLFPEFGVADTDMRPDAIVRIIDGASDMTIKRTVNFDTNAFTSTTTATSSTAITYMAPINVDIPSDHVPLQMNSPHLGRLQSPYIPHHSPRCSTPFHQLSPSVVNERRLLLDPPGNFLIQPRTPILNSQQGLENPFRSADSFGYSSQAIVAPPTYSSSGHPFLPSTSMNSGSLGLISSVADYQRPSFQTDVIPALDVDQRVNQVGMPLYYTSSQGSAVAGASTVPRERDFIYAGLYPSINQTSEMMSSGPNSATPTVYGQEYSRYITPENNSPSLHDNAMLINAGHVYDDDGVETPFRNAVITTSHQNNEIPMTQVATFDAISQREWHADDLQSTILSIPSQSSAPSVSIAGTTCTMMMSSSSGLRPIASTSENKSSPNEPQQLGPREQVDQSLDANVGSLPNEAKVKLSPGKKKENKVHCTTATSSPIELASTTTRSASQQTGDGHQGERKEHLESSSMTALDSLELFTANVSSSNPVPLVIVSQGNNVQDQDDRLSGAFASNVPSIPANLCLPPGCSNSSDLIVSESSLSGTESMTFVSNGSKTLTSSESTNSSTDSKTSTNIISSSVGSRTLTSSESASSSSAVASPTDNVELYASTSEAFRPASSSDLSSLPSSKVAVTSPRVDPSQTQLSSTEDIQSVQVTSSSLVSANSVLVPVTSHSSDCSEREEHASTTTMNVSAPLRPTPTESGKHASSSTVQVYKRPVPSSSTSITPPRSSPPGRELRVMNSPLLEICSILPYRDITSPVPDSTTNLLKDKPKPENKHREIKLASINADESKSSVSKGSPDQPTPAPLKRLPSRDRLAAPTQRQPSSDPASIPTKTTSTPSSNQRTPVPVKRSLSKDSSPAAQKRLCRSPKNSVPAERTQSKNLASSSRQQTPASKSPVKETISRANHPAKPPLKESGQNTSTKSPSKGQVKIPPNKLPPKQPAKIPASKQAKFPHNKPLLKNPVKISPTQSINAHKQFSLQSNVFEKMRIQSASHSKMIVPIVVHVAEGDTTEDEDDEDGKRREHDKRIKKGTENDARTKGNDSSSGIIHALQQVPTSVNSDPSSPAFQDFLDNFLKGIRQNVDKLESERTGVIKGLQADGGITDTDAVEIKEQIKDTNVVGTSTGSTKVVNLSESRMCVITIPALPKETSVAPTEEAITDLLKETEKQTCQSAALNKKSSTVEPVKNVPAAMSREISGAKSLRQSEESKSPQSKKRLASHAPQVAAQAKRRVDSREQINTQARGGTTHVQGCGSVAAVAPVTSSSKPNSTPTSTSDTLANSKAVIESLTRRVTETRSQIQLSTKEKELLQTRQNCYDEYRSILRDLQQHARLTNFDTKLEQDIGELEKKLQAMKKRKESVQLKAMDLNRTIREKSKAALTQKKSCLTLANEVKKLGERLIGEKKYKVPEILVENINELVRTMKIMDSKQSQGLQRERGVIFKQLVLDEGAFSTAPLGSKAGTAPSATLSQVLSAVTTAASTSNIAPIPAQNAPQQMRKIPSEKEKSTATTSSSDPNAVVRRRTSEQQHVRNNSSDVGKKNREGNKMDSKPKPEATLAEEKLPLYITKCSKFVKPEEGKQEETVSEERLPLSEGDFLTAITPVFNIQTFYQNPEENVFIPMNESGFYRLDPYTPICPDSLSQGLCTKQDCELQHL